MNNFSEIPKFARKWEDAGSNFDYWWNRPQCIVNGCFERSLSRRNKCWEHLNSDERNEYRNEIIGIFGATKSLRGFNLSRVDLTGVTFLRGNFEGIYLYGTMLSNSILYGSNFENANLLNTFLESSNLNSSNLMNTNMNLTVLRSTQLNSSHLEGANLENSYLLSTNLDMAYLGGAILKNSTIKSNNISNIKYNPHTRFYYYPFILVIWILSCLYNKLRRKILQRRPILKRYLQTKFIGINTSEIDWSKNPRLISDIRYQQFINDFKNRSWLHKYLFYPLWGLTSYFGESFGLWFMWLILFIAGFGAVYTGYPPPSFLPERVRDFLCNIYPIITLNGVKLSHWFDTYYLSGLVFTSLGLGSFKPENLAGKVWILAEVLLGFIMLGSLISFFANKFVRRD